MKTLNRTIKVSNVDEIVQVRFACLDCNIFNNYKLDMIIDGKLMCSGVIDDEGYFTADIKAEQLNVPLKYYVGIQGVVTQLFTGLITFELA